MIGVLDYGIGNVGAFMRCFELLSIPAARVEDASDLKKISGFLLPGVGSFDMVVTRLKSRGFWEALDRKVVEESRPILGVCVGMQIMGTKSAEGRLPGFGWIDGEVDRLTPLQVSGGRGILPHIGWNQVSTSKPTGLFAGLDGSEFYFLHSFGFHSISGVSSIAQTSYGDSFISGFEMSNLFGAQFHPEKSHQAGLRLLRNFARIVEDA